MRGSQARRGGGAYRVCGLLAVLVTVALFNRTGTSFQVAPGVALVFPAAGVTVAGALILGWAGVVAAFLGFLLSNWGVAASPGPRLLFAIIASVQGAVPLLVGLPEEGSSKDRILRFLLWAVVLNTLLSMMLGVPALVELSTLVEPVGTVALMAVGWFFGDAAAVLLIAAPLILLVRPQLLLDEGDRELLRGFLDRWELHAGLTAMVVVVVLAMELLVPTVQLSCHWLAVLLILPVLLAAARGGVGAGLLVNGLTGSVYLAEVLRLLQPRTGQELFEATFSSYVNLAVFTAVAVVAGLYAGRQASLVSALESQHMGLQRSFERVVTALAAAIEAKDPTTRGHVQRVARLAVAVGRRMGLTGQRLEMLRYAAILHDVGKIGVPEEILNKAGELDPSERLQMEHHVDAGVDILENVDILGPAIPIIRYHQERWDGRQDARFPGYFGLKGEDIPLEARIIAAVDAYDAMTNHRPYRSALSHEEAVAELRREAGRQFDPRVVEALLAVLEEERLEESSSRWPVVSDPVP